MSWTDRLPSRFRQLAYVGVTDDDPEDLRLDKAMLTLVSCLIAMMSFLWVGVYLALGLPWSAAIPFVYQLCVVASLLSFARTKRIGTTRVMLLVLMTVLPFALQWSLGGFENGSAVAAWGGVTPILAYLFGAVGAVWLGAFIVLLGVSAAFESVLSDHAPAIGEGVRAAMFALNLAGPTLVAFFALWYFAGQRNQARAALTQEHGRLVAEQERSERLLLNVLPAEIAQQLRDGSSTIAESHPDVSVLFADIVGFTPLGERLSAEQLVDLLNQIFVVIDDLVVAAGLEKIKTIGDAYMVVGGLPVYRSDHLSALLQLALDMRDATAEVPTPDGVPLKLRVGIDTGGVVAGVIGRRKFSYDVWGDTVNTASRMESHGIPGRVQVTEQVVRAAPGFEFEPRSPIEVKGKGEMATYFLVGRASGVD
jgi:adenylate cyclase